MYFIGLEVNQGSATLTSTDRGLAPQDTPQVGDMDLERVRHVPRSGFAPDDIHQTADADHLAVVQCKRGQHRLPSQTADRPRLPIRDDIHRPQ